MMGVPVSLDTYQLAGVILSAAKDPLLRGRER
jgi:hypothetical protein